MMKVLSHVFSFIKHLFLRLRLVITLSVGREKRNEPNANASNEDTCGKGNTDD